MASYPPPPYGYDARTQRRMEKDRWRAQKRAGALQRNMYREQMRGMRRRSLLGPLLLVAVGVVLLLVRDGRLSGAQVLDVYSRWWPILFVFAGIVLLAEWGLDQALASRRPEAPVVRRGVSGGVIFLLIVLSIGGVLGVHAKAGMQVVGDELGIYGSDWNANGLADLLGDKHESDESMDEQFGSGMSLAVENPRGDVTVTGESTDGKIHVAVHRQVYSRSGDEADRRAQQLMPQISTVGKVMSLRVQESGSETADLTITLPVEAATSVTANRGDVRVTGIKAPVSVIANHGDVELSEIGGDVTAKVERNSSSFSAHNIVGALTLKGHAQDLNLAEIRGQVSLEGEFYGTTHLEKIHGALRFHTSRTDLQTAGLEGEAEVSPDASLTVDRAMGPTVLSTRNRNITLDRLAGDLSVTNTNGTVDVVSAPPLGNVTVENRDGAVNITLPDRAGFTVEAETRDGGVENDFSLATTNANHQTSVSGTVGRGGPRIKITTSHGDVGLRKGGLEATPAAPAVPVPPAAPARPFGKVPVGPVGSGRAPVVL